MAIDREEEAYVFHSTRPFNTKVVSVQDPRSTRSAGNSPDTTLMADDPKRVLRDSTNNLFVRYVLTAELHWPSYKIGRK